MSSLSSSNILAILISSTIKTECRQWYTNAIIEVLTLGSSFQNAELTMNSVSENTSTLTLFSIHSMTHLKIPEFTYVFSYGDNILAISDPFVGKSNSGGMVGGTVGTTTIHSHFQPDLIKHISFNYSLTTQFLKVDLFIRHCIMAFPFLTFIISIRIA